MDDKKIPILGATKEFFKKMFKKKKAIEVVSRKLSPKLIESSKNDYKENGVKPHDTKNENRTLPSEKYISKDMENNNKEDKRPDENEPIKKESPIGIGRNRKSVPPKRDTTTQSKSSRTPSKENLNIPDCMELQDRDTNFVFLFGREQVGKSAITSSLCYFLGTTDIGFLEPRNKKNNREGVFYLQDIFQKLKNKELIDRNPLNAIYEIDLKFTPIGSKTDMKVTFLEMSGEDLREVDIVPGRNQRLPDNINTYLDCGELNLTFFLVTDARNAKRDDQLMFNFINYLAEIDEDLLNNKLLLIISKWDEYEGRFKEGDDVDGFVEKMMPLTYARINYLKGSLTSYSVGEVRNDRIKKVDLSKAKTVSGWLYKVITGRTLVVEPKKSWLDRIIDFIQKLFGQ